MLGEQLLVSPVTEEGAIYQRTYLPKGQWFALPRWSRPGNGQRFVREPGRLPDSIPLYVRAGAVLAPLPRPATRSRTGDYRSEICVYTTAARRQLPANTTAMPVMATPIKRHSLSASTAFVPKPRRDACSSRRNRQGQYDRGAEVFVSYNLYGLFPFRPEKLLRIDGVSSTSLIDEIANMAMKSVGPCRLQDSRDDELTSSSGNRACPFFHLKHLTHISTRT
jgi:hypothetical protein